MFAGTKRDATSHLEGNKPPLCAFPYDVALCDWEALDFEGKMSLTCSVYALQLFEIKNEKVSTRVTREERVEIGTSRNASERVYQYCASPVSARISLTKL
jgi:hypothetical protein